MGTVPGTCDCDSIFNQFTPPSCSVCPELAAPLPIATAEPMSACADGASVPHARASPAHLIMTAHAFTFGLLSATGKLVVGDTSKSWSDDFRHDAQQAADAMTPVGSHILKSSFGA